MWSDRIADMLTRIRNAIRMHQPQAKIPSSKLKTAIAQALLDEGYIQGFDVIEDGKQGILRIDLKYDEQGGGVIQSIKRVSRPGKRVYRAVGDLPRVLNGLGITIVSTSEGVMSDRRCREKKVGGELLCMVY